VRIVVIPSTIASAYVHTVAKQIFAIVVAVEMLLLAAESLEIKRLILKVWRNMTVIKND